jgi:hypothetical protein
MDSNHAVIQNAQEKEIISRSLYDMFYFVRARYGEEKWRLFRNQLEATHSVTQAAIATYGLTPYHLGADMLRSTLRDQADAISNSLTAEPALAKVSPGESGRYFLIKSDNSRILEKERPLINFVLTNYEQQVMDTLGTTGEARKRFEAAVDSTPDKKILVYFLVDPASIAKVFGQPWSTAETGLGFRIPAPGAAVQLNASLAFRYTSLLCLNVVAHEMTHLVASLSRFDAGALKRLPPGAVPAATQHYLKSLLEEFKWLGGDLILGEGLAEYLSGKVSPLQRYGFLADVDDTLRFYSLKNNWHPDVQNLDQKLRTWDPRERILAYQLAHSYTRYLIRRFGMEKILVVLHAPGDYQRVLGATRQELMAAWEKECLAGANKD